MTPPNAPTAAEVQAQIRVDTLLRDFQSACEDYMLCSEPEQESAAKHRAILRNELRSQFLAARRGEEALRAEIQGIVSISVDTSTDAVDRVHRINRIARAALAAQETR